MPSVRRRIVAVLMVVVTAVVGQAGCGSGHSSDQSSPSPRTRFFGIVGDPWGVDEWAAAVGARPSMVMEFEAWSRNRTLDEHFAEAERQGITHFMVTWEPWKTVSAAKGKRAQYTVQPEFTNAAVAAGKKDDYIRAFARSVAASKLTVYLRYAHEMNGDWYPWSRDPANFILAWRRIVNIFREVGADNARFVFSINPSVFEPAAGWEANLRRYWPGDGYVDFVGSTMISFGGRKDYTVGEFVARFERVRRIFGKPLIITEMNTAAEGRVKWLAELRTWLDTSGAPWVDGVILSQAESRGAAQLGKKVGNLSWDVTSDSETQPVIRGMIEDLSGRPNSAG